MEKLALDKSTFVFSLVPSRAVRPTRALESKLWDLIFFSTENSKEILRNFKQVKFAFVKGHGKQDQEQMRQNHW